MSVSVVTVFFEEPKLTTLFRRFCSSVADHHSNDGKEDLKPEISHVEHA